MIYFLRSPQTGYVKIGLTENYHLRLSQLIAQHGDLELLGLMEGSRDKEKALHKRFATDQVKGKGREWFRPSAKLSELIEAEAHLNIPPRPMPVKQYHIRLSERTRRAIIVLGGMMGAETGRKYSGDEVIWALFEKLYPEITEMYREERLKEG